MDRFFSLFGKIMLGTIALILVIGAGYYIGTHKNPSPPITKPTPTAVPTEKPTPTIEQIPSASPSGTVEK